MLWAGLHKAFSNDVSENSYPPIKPGSSGGETAGRRFPESVRQQAFEENPGRICVYCRRPGVATQVDHSIPRVRGEMQQLTMHN